MRPEWFSGLRYGPIHSSSEKAAEIPRTIPLNLIDVTVVLGHEALTHASPLAPGSVMVPRTAPVFEMTSKVVGRAP